METNLNLQVRLLKIGEVADLLRLSSRTVARLVKDGKLPQPIRLGTCTRWRQDQIVACLEGLSPADDSPVMPEPPGAPFVTNA